MKDIINEQSSSTDVISFGRDLDIELIKVILDFFDSLQNQDFAMYKNTIVDCEHLVNIYKQYKGYEYDVNKIIYSYGDRKKTFFVKVNYNTNDNVAYIAVGLINNKWLITGWD